MDLPGIYLGEVHLRYGEGGPGHLVGKDVSERGPSDQVRRPLCVHGHLAEEGAIRDLVETFREELDLLVQRATGTVEVRYSCFDLAKKTFKAKQYKLKFFANDQA